VSIVDDGRCFACGPLSERGLHLQFAITGDGSVRATTVLDAIYQGWVGIAHGGIAMTLIDEAMAHAAGAAGQRCVSADVRVRFRRPLPLGEPLTIEGHVEWRRRNVLGVSASVSDAQGRLLISGTGSMVSHGDIEPGRLGAGTGS
jgi:uncharacterized protein (TIGR00369 family)